MNRFQKYLYLGFGDYYPGKGLNTDNQSIVLILGCIYIFIGMALLTMCFDLMGQELIDKCQWIGYKLGIIESENYKNHDEIRNNSQIVFENNEKIISEKENNLSLKQVSETPSQTYLPSADIEKTKLRVAYINTKENY